MKPGEKTLNVLLAAALIAACTWAFLRFAPVPEPRQDEPAAAADTKTTAPAREATTAATARAVEALPTSRQEGLLGGEVLEGRVDESPGEYAQRLEAVYLERGYRDFGELRRRGRKVSTRESSKLYWRRQYDGSEMICAVGHDADPDSVSPSSEMQLLVTVVSPGADGGSNWTKRRYSASPEVLRMQRGMAEGDMPGQDPPQVPRPKGLRRLFSVSPATPGDGSLAVYAGGEEPSELTDWYRSTMSKSWQYQAAETADSADISGGAMYFTRGDRLCLVWVSPGMTSKSLVVVSVRGG
jgi:hypothetical protein